SYTSAIELSNALQALLPTPTSAGVEKPNFWNQFNTLKHFDQLDSWGKTISDVSKYQWESFTHQHRRFMDPEQFVNGMNTRAGLVKIARMKSLAVKDKVGKFELTKDGVKKLKEKGLSYAQVACLVFDEFDTDFPQMRDILLAHPHYRVSEDPALDAK